MNNQNSPFVHYICLEKMNEKMGMHYTFAADPVTYSCVVIPEENTIKRKIITDGTNISGDYIAEEISERSTNGIEITRHHNLDQTPSGSDILSTAPFPQIWTLRSGIPTPPPLPERLPTQRYRISLNWTHTDALIRSHRFPLHTQNWSGKYLTDNPPQSAIAQENYTILSQEPSIVKKPKPARYHKKKHPKTRPLSGPQKLDAQGMHEPSVMEDVASVFPAGVKAIGVLENKLGKLVHSKSMEAHGEQLQKVAQEGSVNTAGGAVM